MEILLVEDDLHLAKALLTIFKSNSYKSVHVSNIKDGLAQVLSKHFDVIILDWALNKESGVELLREIRDYNLTTPTLMLTAASATEDKVLALDLGADDYLTKPFSTEELLARIRALSRRGSGQKQNIVKLGSLTLNITEQKIFDQDKVLNLTPKEFYILAFMIRNKRTILSRERLAEQINGDLEYCAASNVIDVHIRNIRKKISNPNLIQSVYGMGYKACDDGHGDFLQT